MKNVSSAAYRHARVSCIIYIRSIRQINQGKKKWKLLLKIFISIWIKNDTSMHQKIHVFVKLRFQGRTADEN